MRFTDWVAKRMPLPINRHLQLTFLLVVRDMTGSAARLVPWLALAVVAGGTVVTFRLARLPGVRIAELWSPDTDRWLLLDGEREELEEEWGDPGR